MLVVARCCCVLYFMLEIDTPSPFRAIPISPVSFPAPPYLSTTLVGIPVKTVAMFKVRQQEVVSTQQRWERIPALLDGQFAARRAQPIDGQ